MIAKIDNSLNYFGCFVLFFMKIHIEFIEFNIFYYLCIVKEKG